MLAAHATYALLDCERATARDLIRVQECDRAFQRREYRPLRAGEHSRRCSDNGGLGKPGQAVPVVHHIGFGAYPPHVLRLPVGMSDDRPERRLQQPSTNTRSCLNDHRR